MRQFLKILLGMVLFISTTLASEAIPTQSEVAKIYVATFNRAPDSAGLAYWTNDSGLKLSQIAQSFFDQKETQALYPPNTTNRDFIKSVYKNLFNRAPDTAGWNYWENELNTNRYTKNLFIQTVINGAKDTIEFGKDKKILENKTLVAIAYVDKLGTKTNITDVNNKEDDPAYKASIKILADISEDNSATTNTLSYIDSIKNDTDPMGKITSIGTKIISSLSVGNLKSIAAKGDTLFLGNYAGMLYIVDVSDKNNPSILGTFDTQDIIEDIAIDSTNNRLFIANNQIGVNVIDISDLSSPHSVTSMKSGYARAIKIKNSVAYVASGYAGINMFNINTYKKIANIPVEGDFTDSIAIFSHYALSSDAYDKNIIVSDTNTLKKVSTIAKAEAFYEAKKDLNIIKNTLYVADGLKGLMLFDINAFPNASLLSTSSPSSSGSSHSVAVSSDESRAYVAALAAGIDIYDISNKSNPKLLQTIATPGGAANLTLSSNDKYLYVADSQGGLQIIELNSIADQLSVSVPMNLNYWNIYGTASLKNGVFSIGDKIGSDANDIDSDQNLWNNLVDELVTDKDYDVIVSKNSFTPPLDLKFTGSISTTNMGYNEVGFAYKNENYTRIIGEGVPIGKHLAEFVFRWEQSNTLNTYVDTEGYGEALQNGNNIYVSNSYLTGDFEISWDGQVTILYFNGAEVYRANLTYKEGKDVVVFFKNYENDFNISNISITN